MEEKSISNQSGKTGTGRPSLLKRKRVLFAGGALVIAMVFLVYMGIDQFATYYISVSEFVAKGDSVYGEQIRVAGHVLDDSVTWDTQTVTLNFTLADGKARLPVIYEGVVPDTFKADTDIVVEGKSDQQGVFHATKLITKCPSKYEPAE